MTWDIFPTVTDLNLLPGRTNVSGLRNFKFSITNWLKVMVLLSPRNGQCGIEPGLQVSCHLLHFRFSGVEAFDVGAVFLAVFEKIICCQDLVCVRPLKTGLCGISFHATTDSIAGTFPMRCGKEVPLCPDPKVSHVVQKIDEIVAVLVLSSTSIRPVNELFKLGMGLLQQWNQGVQESMNHGC